MAVTVVWSDGSSATWEEANSWDYAGKTFALHTWTEYGEDPDPTPAVATIPDFNVRSVSLKPPSVQEPPLDKPITQVVVSAGALPSPQALKELVQLWRRYL